MSVLLLSGGVDSLALLSQECNEGRSPHACITFDYGQKHRRGIESAGNIANAYRILRHIVVSLPPDIFRGSVLTGVGEIPHAHYTDPAQKATVVAGRNLVFLSVAASFAVKLGACEVIFAAHAGDAAIYSDCRPEFVEAVNRAMILACGIGVRAPFLGWPKAKVVDLARLYKAPLRLAWSCYEGGAEPCGKCGACVECAEAGC